MSVRVSESPFSLDPLMAEAKRRARRRRVVLVALVVMTSAVAVTLALRSSGGPSSVGPSARTGRAQSQALLHVRVPVDAIERRWRGWIAGDAAGAPAQSSSLPGLHRELENHVAMSGAVVVRLRFWRVGGKPRVELVAATATRPAVYIKHHLEQLLGGIPPSWAFVEIVNSRGRRILESARRNNGGRDYLRPELRNCIPLAFGVRHGPPCPAH